MYKIYCITNIINNKKYVGLTKFSLEKRWKSHIDTAFRKKKKYAIHYAMIKHGIDNFKIDLLEETENKDQESFWIEKLNTKVDGYNLTKGGDGTSGWNPTKNQLQALSISAKKLHAEKKIGMHGKKHSLETRQKMSESSPFKGKFGKDHPSYGKKHSPETILKFKNRIVSDETKQKMSARQKLLAKHMDGANNPMYGKKHSAETLQLISEKAKSRAKISCIYCERLVSPGNYARWHGDKCKHIKRS